MEKHKTPLVQDLITNNDLLQDSYVDSSQVLLGSAKKEPATSNTPVLVTTNPPYLSSLGWVTLSFVVEDLMHLMPMVRLVSSAVIGHLYDGIVDETGSYRGYRHAIRFASGAVIAYSKIRKDFIVVLEQSLCERIAPFYLFSLVKDLINSGARVTRLDLTVDDLTRSLNLKQIDEAYHNGCMVARTKALKYEVGYSAPNVLCSEIVRIGKRSSQFYVRIYDKYLESNGQLNAIRFEVELKQELAHHSFLALSLCAFPPSSSNSNLLVQEIDLEGFNKTILGIIASKLNFCDPSSDSNISRRTPLYWWQQFLAGVEKIKIKIPRVRSTIKTIQSWFLRSIVASLALLIAAQDGSPEEYLKELVELGYIKFKARHRSILAEFKQAPPIQEVDYYQEILRC